MTAGLVVLVVVLLAATVFGLWPAGRLSAPKRRNVGLALTRADLGQDPGQRATLVQFSSAFCAPCRATRQVLSHVAATVDGVRHVEVDAESHLDLVRRMGVTRTPTTFVLDHRGHVVQRSTGVPRLAQVVGLVDSMGSK